MNLKYIRSWSSHAKEAADKGNPYRIVKSNTGLNADFPFATCDKQHAMHAEAMTFKNYSQKIGT